MSKPTSTIITPWDFFYGSRKTATIAPAIESLERKLPDVKPYAKRHVESKKNPPHIAHSKLSHSPDDYSYLKIKAVPFNSVKFKVTTFQTGLVKVETEGLQKRFFIWLDSDKKLRGKESALKIKQDLYLQYRAWLRHQNKA